MMMKNIIRPAQNERDEDKAKVNRGLSASVSWRTSLFST